jgi:hypothetical protein
MHIMRGFAVLHTNPCLASAAFPTFRMGILAPEHSVQFGTPSDIRVHIIVDIVGLRER